MTTPHLNVRFTPATERALSEAAGWTRGDQATELHLPEVLLGLLAQPECRAATVLAAVGIDATRIRQRWPELQLAPGEPGRARRWSAEVRSALHAAQTLLADYPQPLELATEQLLLGVVAAEEEVSHWLREHGLVANTLAADIHRLYGHTDDVWSSEPLEMPAEASEEIAPHKRSTERPATTSEPAAANGRPSDAAEAARGRQTEQAKPAEPARPGPDDRARVDRREQLSASDDPPPSAAPAPDADCPASAVSRVSEQRPVRPWPRRKPEEVAVQRIIDAAANRAAEGLRVAEDWARFGLDDRHLTELCKSLRHELATSLQAVERRERLAARETRADVGATVKHEEEHRRSSVADVVAASFQRVQQALRSIEEYGKLIEGEFSATCERLRYRCYTIERAFEMTAAGAARLAATRLYVLIDGGTTADDFAARARSLIDAGVHVLQLREKRLDDRDLLGRARQLRTLTSGTNTLFMMNDRADLAAAAGADGVHLGQEDLCVKDARRLVGPDALIGVSTHSLGQARQAVLDGANYIGVGPTFSSNTKHFDRFPGLALLAAVAAEVSLPAFAIGGISATNLDQVLATGIHRIAVSGAVATANDPAAAARELLHRLA